MGFWIYGDPAFDYMMQRWKPVADHADSTLGTMQYRWREYQEGGYVFGIIGEFDQHVWRAAARMAEPRQNKPISYRYNAFWAMRDCRGEQFKTTLTVPALADSRSPRPYGITTVQEDKLNLVLYYGYPYIDPKSSQRVDKLSLHVKIALPTDLKPHTLTISRADAQNQRGAGPAVDGQTLDLTIDVPALSAVSIELH